MIANSLKLVAPLALVLCAETAGAQEKAERESTYTRRGSPDFDEAVLRYMRNERPKIIGGKPAAPNEYPWQASLADAS